ncbi:hypothetical protein UlMin_009519 [Ulmus minor]
MVEAKLVKRKHVFIKVDQLQLGTNGHTLTVKVVIDLIKPGTTVILCNETIDMFKGSSMRLDVDKCG